MCLGFAELSHKDEKYTNLVLFFLPSIGYPVVTMSFLIKHQITHIIRQVSYRGLGLCVNDSFVGTCGEALATLTNSVQCV